MCKVIFISHAITPCFFICCTIIKTIHDGSQYFGKTFAFCRRLRTGLKIAAEEISNRHCASLICLLLDAQPSSCKIFPAPQSGYLAPSFLLSKINQFIYDAHFCVVRPLLISHFTLSFFSMTHIRAPSSPTFLGPHQVTISPRSNQILITRISSLSRCPFLGNSLFSAPILTKSFTSPSREPCMNPHLCVTTDQIRSRREPTAKKQPERNNSTETK